MDTRKRTPSEVIYVAFDFQRRGGDKIETSALKVLKVVNAVLHTDEIIEGPIAYRIS